jgi:hypothetical protein
MIIAKMPRLPQDNNAQLLIKDFDEDLRLFNEILDEISINKVPLIFHNGNLDLMHVQHSIKIDL